MNERDVNSPEEFTNMTSEDKQKLCSWIRSNLVKIKTVNQSRTSYGLKHIFEHSENGFYTTNGQFKGAMLECGFEPYEPDEINWKFCFCFTFGDST